MSDWEDSPDSQTASSPKPIDLDCWDDIQPVVSSKEVSDWSDAETGGEKHAADAGGEDNYYPEHCNDGGYRRERRNNYTKDDAGTNGYRKDRSDGQTEGGGGNFRRRREVEDVSQLLCSSSSGLRVPSSYDKQTVKAFLNQINIGATNQTLGKLRQQRNYLMAAYKELVDAEWETIQDNEREQRKEKSKKLCDAVADSERYIEELRNLLSAENESQPLQLNENFFMNNLTNEQHSMETSFMVPTIPSRQRRTQNDASEMLITQGASPEQPRTRSQTRRRTERVIQPVFQSTSAQIQRIKDLLQAAARNYRESGGIINSSSSSLVASTSKHIKGRPRPVASAFKQIVSEEYVCLHEMNRMTFCMPRELRTVLLWPHIGPNSTWLCSNQPTNSTFMFLAENSYIATEHLQIQPQQDQASSLLGVPRQQRSQMQETDYNRLAINAHSTPLDNIETFGGSGVSITPLPALSNEGPTSMQLTMPGSSQLNLNDEDSLLMPPPSLPLDLDGIVLPKSDDTALQLIRSRHAHVSTPLQSYRPQLPAIDEEQQQHRRKPSTMGRVLEMSEHSPLPPRTSDGETGEAEAVVVNNRPSATSTPLIPTSPMIVRDWASIFRPRESIPNYEELHRAHPTQRRRRRRPAVRNSPQHIEAAQPRSNEEITTSFLADLLQAAREDVNPPPIETIPQQELNEMLPVLTAAVAITAGNDQMTDELPQINELPPVMEMEKQEPEGMEIIFPMCTTALSTEEQLPEQPIVTSMKIYMPGSASVNAAQSANNTGYSSMYPPTLVSSTPFTKLMNEETRMLVEDQLPQIEQLPPHSQQQNQQDAAQAVQDQLYRESLDDLGFIIQHADMLRLMIDHQKQLGEEQKHKNRFSIENLATSYLAYDESDVDNNDKQRYISLAALYTYEPKIILEMPEVKVRVIHGLIGALIMCPRVDMKSAPFIKTRLEAAYAYRTLFELNAAKIINLSKDGRFASLC